MTNCVLTRTCNQRRTQGGPISTSRDADRRTTRDCMQILGDTDWSLIDRAVVSGSASSSAMESISRRYWPVVYGYARACGCDVHEAGDITQGFLCDEVLTGRLLEHADPERGRFRNLLRTTVRNYVVDLRRKRSGRGNRPAELDARGGEQIAPADRTNLAPADVFDSQWAAALIRRVLQDVRRHYVQQCQEAHWEVFVGRVVRPMLFEDAATPYERLVEQFDLTDASQASNMMVTVKRKFARAMRAEVAQTVSDPAEVDDELRELMAILQRGVLQ